MHERCPNLESSWGCTSILELRTPSTRQVDKDKHKHTNPSYHRSDAQKASETEELGASDGHTHTHTTRKNTRTTERKQTQLQAALLTNMA